MPHQQLCPHPPIHPAPPTVPSPDPEQLPRPWPLHPGLLLSQEWASSPVTSHNAELQRRNCQAGPSQSHLLQYHQCRSSDDAGLPWGTQRQGMPGKRRCAIVERKREDLGPFCIGLPDPHPRLRPLPQPPALAPSWAAFKWPRTQLGRQLAPGMGQPCLHSPFSQLYPPIPCLPGARVLTWVWPSKSRGSKAAGPPAGPASPSWWVGGLPFSFWPTPTCFAAGSHQRRGKTHMWQLLHTAPATDLRGKARGVPSVSLHGA